MYRVDTNAANTAGALPAPVAATAESYFQDTGNPGTVVPADWANMVQEELRAVVVAGGLAPSKTTYTQVRDAIKLLVSIAGYAVDSGAANAMVAALAPSPPALAAGLSAEIKVAATNTGATTLNLNGLGAKAVQLNGAALTAGTLIAGQIYNVIYDGAGFQVLGLNTPRIGRAQFQNTQASGTNSGEAIPSAAWTQRALGTQISNTITGCALAANQVTLPAGTYRASIVANASVTSGSGFLMHRLRDVTAGATINVSPSAYQDQINTPITFHALFTLAVAHVIEVDTFITDVTGGNGGAAATSGEAEVYLDLLIEKVG